MSGNITVRYGFIDAKGKFPKDGEVVFAYWMHKGLVIKGNAYHLVNKWYRRAHADRDWECADIEGWLAIPPPEYFMNCRESGEKADDPVNSPAHYKAGDFECFDVMLAVKGPEKVRNWCECNAFKYIWRNDKKNGLEDIQKCQWYLDKFEELSKECKEV